MRLILLLAMFTVSSYSQMRQRLLYNDLELSNLKGPVKSVTHTDFEPALPSDTAKARIDHFILYPNNYTSYFNRDGYRTKKTEYDLDHKSQSLTPKWEWIYKYDSTNRITKEWYIWSNRSDTLKSHYSYPDNNTTIIDLYSKTYKHQREKYLQEGMFEYFSHANADSSYISKTRIVYDNLNRIVRTEEYQNHSYIQYINCYTFDDNASRLPITHILIAGKFNSPPIITKYHYDINGNEIGSNTDILPKITYTYDKYNNWTEKCIQLKNGRIKISRRKFEYY